MPSPLFFHCLFLRISLLSRCVHSFPNLNARISQLTKWARSERWGLFVLRCPWNAKSHHNVHPNPFHGGSSYGGVTGVILQLQLDPEQSPTPSSAHANCPCYVITLVNYVTNGGGFGCLI